MRYLVLIRVNVLGVSIGVKIRSLGVKIGVENISGINKNTAFGKRRCARKYYGQHNLTVIRG